ncbi:hypothetical protein [Endozoicomonas sp. YOMI1]|uniref:hypothetical protein n=1 Tax=Endozoicomonas sp. YOMI1 TaxID=2828739 RepID=UPI0021484916|nr:hypothetical protein [Endozoicomonas sp. YOMI1]
MAGFSAQEINSFRYGYLQQEEKNQDIPLSPRSLNDFSIAHLPTITNELWFPEFSQEDLDAIVPVAPESSGSGEPLPLTLAGAHGQQSRKEKAYAGSEKRKNYQRAWAQSEKRRAYNKAYRESEQGKAYLKVYKKAYYEVLKKTGDKEQAKIAGKQATAFMRESNKAKNE